MPAFRTTSQKAIPVWLATDDGLGSPDGSSADPRYYARLPSADASASLVPVVGAGVSALLIKNAPGNFYGASAVNGATAGFLIAYNASSIPAANASLSANLILGMNVLGASGSASIDPSTVADRFSAGIVILVSTSTTTYTVPANLPLFLRGRAA